MSSVIVIATWGNILIFIAAVGLSLQAALGLAFLISCIWEKEKRATIFAVLQFIAMIAIFFIYLLLIWIGFFQTTFGAALLIAGYFIVSLSAYFLVRRTEPNQRALQGTKGYIVGSVERFDGRMSVIARNEMLQPGSDPYDKFYSEHPDLEEYDARRREKGGPVGQVGRIDRPYEGPNVAAFLAHTSIPFNLTHPHIVNPGAHPELSGDKIDISPEEATTRIKGFAKSVGADLVGIAAINPLWLYSHLGDIFHENWEDWGKKIPTDHKYAIVVATEMSFEMISAAPHTSCFVEAWKNYAKGAFITTQIAAFIANLGYKASANCALHNAALFPPLAVDAGIGEMGRIGYVMTKEFGPRIRLSVVTTDIPLIPDKPVDIGAEDFCIFCKKCATCCPSQSIPDDDDLKEFNGTLKWKLNEQTCFSYWSKIGTDCTICMNVCPWSHARTFPHRLIVWLISRNKYARRMFSVMDDIFYGKKPKPKDPPQWAWFRK